MNFDHHDYHECRLCPRQCAVDRADGERGVCGESAELRVAAVLAHHGEEPCFSGSGGSGTIFFSGCASRCFFCQNHQISLDHVGRVMSIRELVDDVRDLVAAGVHNINFVTPDHFWPHIEFICRRLRDEGVGLPFIFNCSGYERVEMVRRYAEVMDIFLPDFKFMDGKLARGCMGDAEYGSYALEAIREMVACKGFLEPWAPDTGKTAERGVLVRHLVLPGHSEDSIRILEILHREFGPMLPLSVMSQYRPTSRISTGRPAEFRRRVSESEYSMVVEAVLDLGFRRVYLQEMETGTEYVPDFAKKNPFPGNRS